ncbi:hypothetical protein E1B28_000227 [Marasmius oreades]|uniref:Uncharacterized protein n=1 Tax=Marasmius oreades TaxID=181124 RepID=A0A9P8AED6_9AGAR|nr:uncharacterized protein E1B28_000227 [Marasmius oreades]KAG7098265.1 hypothetical protein E1B28_000227 [Marasmius oreades]
MCSVSPKYHHRQQDHLPRKMPYDNMKQLLSKPAVIPTLAGPSESGGYSPSAQREGGADISTQPKRRTVSEETTSRALGSLKSLGRGHHSVSDTGGMRYSNWVPPWNVDAESSTEGLTSPKRLGFFSRSPSLTRKYVSDGENVSSGNGKGKEKDKKYRGVLRRKPSLNRPTSPISSDFKPPIFASGLASLSSPFSSSFLSPSSANPTSPHSFSHSQISTLRPPNRSSKSNSFSPSPSRGSSRNSSRSRVSTQEGKHSSVNMTPAEEVMLAYKNQMEIERSIERSFEEAERKAIEARRLSDEKEMAREELERGREQIRMVQGGIVTPIQPSHGRSPASLVPEITPPTPYYTVVGSTFGRAVPAGGEDEGEEHGSSGPAVGGLSQASYSKGRHRTASVSVGASKPSKDPHGFGKTLGRKLSLKWNGLKGSKHESFDPEFGGHPSLHEKRFSGRRATSPATPDKGAYTALRLSIERPYATTPRVPSHRPGGESVDAAGSPKLHSASPPGPPSTSTSSPGSTGSPESKVGFRSIIRRLSTGALRDQNQNRSKNFARSDPNTCPPPVPALPQGVVSMIKTGSASKPTVANVPGNPIRKVRDRRANSDNSAYRRPQTSTGTPQTVLPISSGSSTTTSNRPSTATRSSSPERYSGSPRSTRSSTSSYGREAPPLPTSPNIKADLPRYILSPAELTALQNHESNSTILEGGKKLPIPPYQRRLQTPQTEDLGSPSPTIPEFSTVSPINAFKKSTPGRPATSAGVVRALAPPFSMRNSQRPTTASDSPTSPLSRTTPLVPIYSGYVRNDDGRHPSPKDIPLPPSRKSTSSIIPKPSSPHEGRISTEEIWEGLLQKSARAGGTLHIYTDRLESDNLRFSVTDSD